MLRVAIALSLCCVVLATFNKFDSYGDHHDDYYDDHDDYDHGDGDYYDVDHGFDRGYGKDGHGYGDYFDKDFWGGGYNHGGKHYKNKYYAPLLYRFGFHDIGSLIAKFGYGILSTIGDYYGDGKYSGKFGGKDYHDNDFYGGHYRGGKGGHGGRGGHGGHDDDYFNHGGDYHGDNYHGGDYHGDDYHGGDYHGDDYSGGKFHGIGGGSKFGGIHGLIGKYIGGIGGVRSHGKSFGGILGGGKGGKHFGSRYY